MTETLNAAEIIGRPFALRSGITLKNRIIKAATSEIMGTKDNAPTSALANLHAILELAKGKLTTEPEKHTGEGIFFSSRMFDLFYIESGTLRFVHLEAGEDWIVEKPEKSIAGTSVFMRVDPNSKRTAREDFDKFSTELEEYGFTKTKVPVALAKYGDENLISRSQAKRLLARFDRFKEVVLDFSGVESIGPAFADEIFRVYLNQHPNVKLTHVNATAYVTRMIQRGLNH